MADLRCRYCDLSSNTLLIYQEILLPVLLCRHWRMWPEPLEQRLARYVQHARVGLIGVQLIRSHLCMEGVLQNRREKLLRKFVAFVLNMATEYRNNIL